MLPVLGGGSAPLLPVLGEALLIAAATGRGPGAGCAGRLTYTLAALAGSWYAALAPG
jgi:hypothetical protein